MALNMPTQVSNTAYQYSPNQYVAPDVSAMTQQPASSGGYLSNIGNFIGNIPTSSFLGGVAAAGGGIALNESMKRLSELGEQAFNQAQQVGQFGLQNSQFRPYTVTSTTGSQFGVGYTPASSYGVADMNASGGTAGTGMMGTAGEALGADVAPAQYGLGATLALSPQEQAMQNSLFGNAGQLFNQAAMPTQQREQDIYGRIRAAQTPEEERQRMALEERLFTQGRGGVQTNMYGGTPQELALAKAQEEARNQAYLVAMQQAQQEQQQQANLGQQFMGQSYIPQAQLLDVIQGTSRFPELAQQAQQYGTGQFSEALMSGIEAQLLAENQRSNLLGQLGSGLLSGGMSSMSSPNKSKSTLSSAYNMFKSLIGA